MTPSDEQGGNVASAAGDDKRLVQRMLDGDEPAFDIFFAQSFPGLYRFALSRVGYDADTAEEVAQATVCKAITKLSTYRGEAALFTWLCTFCRHEISAHYRRHGRIGRHHELDEDNPEVRAALELLARDAPAGSEQLVHQKEVARLVQTTLDHLPPRYGDALEWKYIHGLSVVDIAGRLSVGPKAAESLLTRAREAFREGFDDLCRGALPTVREGAGS